jgi:hypothetical protein
MALSRIRFHRLHSRGLERSSILAVFIPLWLIITCLACLPVKAPWKVRLATARAIGAGAVTGYAELLRHGSAGDIRNPATAPG